MFVGREVQREQGHAAPRFTELENRRALWCLMLCMHRGHTDRDKLGLNGLGQHAQRFPKGVASYLLRPTDEPARIKHAVSHAWTTEGQTEAVNIRRVNWRRLAHL